MSRRKLILVLAALLVVIIGFAFFASRPKGQLTIQVAPADSSITLNGKKTLAGSFDEKPGDYTVVASRNGFGSYTKKFSLKKNTNEYVGVILGPNSASTINWYKQHPDDQQLAEVISGKNFSIDVQQQITKYPIIKYLPFVDQFYRIDYGRSVKSPNNPEAVAIYITFYSQEGKSEALQWIKFKGYDPNQLEIIYQDRT